MPESGNGGESLPEHIGENFSAVKDSTIVTESFLDEEEKMPIESR